MAMSAMTRRGSMMCAVVTPQISKINEPLFSVFIERDVANFSPLLR